MSYQQYEKEIAKSISQYQNFKGTPKESRDLAKKAKNLIKTYQFELRLADFADQSRIQQLEQQYKKIVEMQEMKLKANNVLTAQDVLHFGQKIQKDLDEVQNDIEQAVSGTAYLGLQLDQNIQKLDLLEDENKEFKKRIKRAKEGLKVIIKRAMMNKCTQFLMVLVLLAIIGLITVSVLVDKKIINVTS